MAARCGCSVISTKTVCSLHTSGIGDAVCIWAGNTVRVDCVFCYTDDHYTRVQTGVKTLCEIIAQPPRTNAIEEFIFQLSPKKLKKGKPSPRKLGVGGTIMR